MRKSMYICITVITQLILHIHFLKIIFAVRRPRKWGSDVEFYPQIRTFSFRVWSYHWEAAVRAGTTFPSTPRTQVAM